MSTVPESLEQQLAEEGLPTFKYIVENSIDAILMTNSELRIVYSNRACNQLMARNVTGQPLRSLWFEEDLPLLNSSIERAKVGGFFSAARLNGFHSVVDQYPGIEIVGTLAADWDRAKGRQAAEEFLKANPPGTLDVIWAASGEMGLGAMLAVEAAGRQDEVKVFTNDVTPESADRMREGRLMAETYHGFAEWGWYGTRFAVMLALGQKVPPTFDIRPRTMYRGNADQFYPTPALEPVDWEQIKAGRKLPPKIVIGWAPADISGVFQTATAYFEKAAAEAREHGINVEIITQTPATHVAFADQVAIIEDYIQRRVDAIVLSAIEVEAIKPAVQKANQAGIPVIIVNQLEPIEGVEVASYIGFDNTVAGAISAYAVVDYLGGPGVLGAGEKVRVKPETHLDLAWWQALYKDVDPRAAKVKGRVAIIEGISGSWRGENRLVRPDGSVLYVDSTTFPIHDRAGRFMGLVASFRDATRRRQAEEELRRYRVHMEEMIEERTAELRRTTEQLEQEIAERKQVEETLRASEERFALAEKGASDGLYDWDIQNDTLYWSPRFKELLGYAEDELDVVNLGTFEAHLHPDDRERIKVALEAHLKERVPYNVEERLRTKSGEYRWFSARGQALWDEAGNPIRMTGHITDITERKRMEEALAEERNLLRTLIDNLPDPIYTKDTEGRYLINNTAHMRFLGAKTPEEVVGKSVFEFYPQELAAQYYADDQEVIRSGQPLLRREEQSVDRAGNRVWFLTTKVPLRDRDGKVVGLVGIARDITERKLAEEALERRALQLQTAAEVSRAISSILNPDELIQQVVNLVRERFGLYYVGLFLVDESGRWAVLRAGTGEAGQKMLETGHRLEVGGTSMIGWCVANRQARIALDVGEEAVRFENPLLPETRSELALPLISRGQAIGAMTIQSAQPAAFSEEDITVLQTMADQLAIAIENARLFDQTQAALAELEATHRLYVREQWAEYIPARVAPHYERTRPGVPPLGEAVLSEVEQAMARRELVVRSGTGDGAEQALLVAPISLRGEVIGALGLHETENRRQWTDDEVALIEAVAEQMALAIENARLLEQTQRRAARDRLLAEITARVRSSLDPQTILRTAVRELGAALGTDRAFVQIGLDTPAQSARPTANGAGSGEQEL